MDQEHDCLPTLDHTGNWILSDAAVRSIAEALERIIPTVSTANEVFEKLRQLWVIIQKRTKGYSMGRKE